MDSPEKQWRARERACSIARSLFLLEIPGNVAFPIPFSPENAVRPTRHAAILELVRSHRVPSQERLRELLAERGIEVAQATLSRDIRDLGLVKVPDEQGGSVYTVPSGSTEPIPTLNRLLPALFTGADGVGNLLVLRTVVGGAQPLAVALDAARWSEVVGTVAGDDTILIVLRAPEQLQPIRTRIEKIAGGRG